MRNPILLSNFEKKLESSKFGNFDATIKCKSGPLEYASVRIESFNYEFHVKLIEAIQPILDELKIEMDAIVMQDDEDNVE